MHRFVALFLQNVLMAMMSISVLIPCDGSVRGVSAHEVKHHQFEEHGSDMDDSVIRECSSDGGPCSQTGQCCPGYICSLRDSSATAAGSCVREDHSRSSCRTDAECSNEARCIMGMDGQGSCHIRVDSNAQRAKEWSQHMYTENKGGLGAACESTSHCKAYTLDGKDELCCQDVNRGRYGTKRMCDRVTGISKCING